MEQQAITTVHGQQPTKEQQPTLTRWQRWIGAALILLTIFGVKELVHSHHQQQQLDQQVHQLDQDSFNAQMSLYESCVKYAANFRDCGPIPSMPQP